MKTRYLVLVVLLACVLAGQATADNLLVNPGFEQCVNFRTPYNDCPGPGTYIGDYGWNAVYYTGASGMWNSSGWGTHSGGCGLAVYAYNQAEKYVHTEAYQEVRVSPSSQCAASVYVKAWDYGSGFGRSLNDFAAVIVTEYDSAGTQIGLPHRAQTTTADNVNWQLLQIPQFTTNGFTSKVRYCLETQSYGVYPENVDYDDCVLDVTIPEPGSMLTLLGGIGSMVGFMVRRRRTH